MEAIAILSYTRERNIQFLSSIFPVVSSENAQKAVKNLRSIIFPEEAVNDARYLLKAKEMMKKLLSVELKVRPVKTSGEREFSRIK
jgi:hypothetical protein